MNKSPETMDFTRMVTLHDIAMKLWGAQAETTRRFWRGPSGGPQTRRGSDLHRPDGPKRKLCGMMGRLRNQALHFRKNAMHCNFIGNMTIT